MRTSNSAVVSRNITWAGKTFTDPFEAGWASEAVFFVRALKACTGSAGIAHVEISPDGMRWVREGTQFSLPTEADEVTFAKVVHYGNWLRLAVELPDESALTVLVTIHCKS
jgi:hypothetical protein